MPQLLIFPRMLNDGTTSPQSVHPDAIAMIRPTKHGPGCSHSADADAGNVSKVFTKVGESFRVLCSHTDARTAWESAMVESYGTIHVPEADRREEVSPLAMEDDREPTSAY